MALTFDGPTLTVVLDTVSINYTAQEIYSRWKEWVLADNANWPPAFRTIGGDDLGGSVSPPFYFLRNDLGWTIKKPEATIDVTIDGNLVFENPTGSRYTNPLGAFTPTIVVNLSSVAPVNMQLILDSIEAASGLTAVQAAELNRVYIAHFHKRTRISEEITLYAADGTTPLYTFNALDDGSLIDPDFNPDI